MSIPESPPGGQVYHNQDSDIQTQIQKWKHLSLEEHRLRLYCEMKSNEDHGRGEKARAHHWSSQAKEHAHKSDEFNRICMQLILQQNNATPSSTAAFNAGASTQVPPSLNQGSQQTFQLQPTYSQHHNQHHVGAGHQQVYANHPQPQNGPQPFQFGAHQPHVNQQQPQPGFQQPQQHAFDQPQAGYYQPQQQYQQSGYPGQQQNHKTQQDQNPRGIFFRLAKSCCTTM